MAFTNSPLVTYTKISPHKNARTSNIDTITIHTMACVGGTLEACGNLFQTKKASSNYGIDSKGRIGMYVPESHRSWATSNDRNDDRAVTIEVANDGGENTGWHISPEAMKSLINLIADVCRRNNIAKLKWSTDKNERMGHLNGCNMTVHRDYAAKSCPGDYLYSKHGYIADEVNKLLGGFEYNEIVCKVKDKKGVILKCDKLDISSSDGIKISRIIYPYTSRQGVSGAYVEFTATAQGTQLITDNLSKSNLTIRVT